MERIRRTLRLARQVAAIALSVVLCSTVNEAAARTPGEFFAPLREGNAAVFDNVPAYLIRMYLNTALATYAKQCPHTAPKYSPPWQLGQYVATLAHPRTGIAGNLISMAASARLSAWSARADGENDVLWLYEQSGCAASIHQSWVTHVKAMAEDPRIAGPLPEADKLCQESGGASNVCQCFATSFEMEATPVERRRVLDAKPQLEGLRATLRNGDLSSRVSYKCEASPAIVSPETEYIHTPDDQYRLKEGVYRVRIPQSRNPDASTATCKIKRQLNWQYLVECHLAPRGLGTLSKSGQELTVAYRGSKGDETYSVLPDGRLRLQSRSPSVAMELVPAEDSAATEQAPDTTTRRSRSSPAEARGGAATEQQCARLSEDLEKLRARSRNPNGIARLEERYARWCVK